MEQIDAERLNSAVAALNEDELDPFVALIAPEMVWKGEPHGWLWWRHTPG